MGFQDHSLPEDHCGWIEKYSAGIWILRETNGKRSRFKQAKQTAAEDPHQNIIYGHIKRHAVARADREQVQKEQQNACEFMNIKPVQASQEVLHKSLAEHDMRPRQQLIQVM